MAKKKNLAERIDRKRKNAQKTKAVNPFEMHFNKRKMEVIGQTSKNELGFPGLSRSNAIQKRKNTILKQHEMRNKSNKFIDQRIGQRNSEMSETDRSIARFVSHRTKEYKKKFVLDEMDTEEVLTHRGQTLSEIEKFDNPNSDDDDDDLEFGKKSGNLDSDFVKEGHFGGGLFKVAPKSHKDVINELISEHKKRKAESKRLKEQTTELAEQLNAQWEDLKPIFIAKKVDKKADPVSKVADDYDKKMAMLMQENRHPAVNRLKTEDEIAKEEKEKLEKLEKERVARMQGDKSTAAPKHRSADDLDDGFQYDNDFQVMLAYDQDGKSLIDVNKLHQGEGDEEEDGKAAEPQGEEEDDEDQSDEEDEVETESEDNYSDLEDDSDDDNSSEDEVRGVKRKRGFEENEKEDDDNANEQSEDVSGDEEKESVASEDDDKVEEKCETEEEEDDTNEDAGNKSIESDKEEETEVPKKDLPFTFDVSSDYEEFQKNFDGRTSKEHGVIIERMVKCNHPKLGEQNKKKMDNLFEHLLRYLSEICYKLPVEDCFKILGAILPHLFDLVQTNPQNAPKFVVEMITEKQQEYRRNKKRYPGFEVLFFLKIVSCLFSTSDFRNQAVTPCFAFIENMLFSCRVKTQGDIAFGLFLVTLVLEYTNLSKRYLPAAILYLAGMLHMAIPKHDKTVKILPPFRSSSSALALNENCPPLPLSLRMRATDLTATEITENFKLRALYTTLKLIGEFVEIYKDHPSNCEIFVKIFEYLSLIPKETYPKVLEDDIVALLDVLAKQKSERKLNYLALIERPKALRLYDPVINPVYDHKRHAKTADTEQAKKRYKLKKETKGALREIRKDRKFMAGVHIKERIESDRERIQKVKRIFADGAIQQGELKKMEKQRKK